MLYGERERERENFVTNCYLVENLFQFVILYIIY